MAGQGGVWTPELPATTRVSCNIFYKSVKKVLRYPPSPTASVSSSGICVHFIFKTFLLVYYVSNFSVLYVTQMGLTFVQ